jgi:hypothetical protein
MFPKPKTGREYYIMKRSSVLGFVLIAFCMFFFGAVSSTRADDNCAKVPVTQQGNSGATGHAVLCVSEDGVQASMKVRNLVSGNAYTVWFVYFDNPAACTSSGLTGPGQPCGAADLTTPVPDALHPGLAPPGVFGRMDSAVADEDGQARFSAKLQDFKVSKGSLVWLFIFNHGPASTDNEARARQLLTPETPGLGAPGLGLLVRKGFGAGVAVFNIPATTSN